jgi:hypothetical protein
MKNFAKWTVAEFEDFFQIRPVENQETLSQWLTATIPVSDQDRQRLIELCHKLRRHVHDWNEEELKMQFISLLLELVDYDQEAYQVFFERQMSVMIERQRLWGVVDCLIASGKRVPKRPFFCLHEYKPERHTSNDPLGQTLVAMLTAQRLNDNQRPMYGAYVVGRLWYFLVLEEPVYGLSLAYDATKEAELIRIFMALQYIKEMIEQTLSSGGLCQQND